MSSRSSDSTPQTNAPAGSDALELQWTTPVRRGRESLRDAKQQLQAQLREWTIDERTTNAVVDVVHELVGNAMRHARPPVVVVVRASTLLIRVEVIDGDRSPARVLPYRPGISEHGLGLRIVQQLSQEWGQQLLDDGKSVWATFPRR